MVGDGRLVDAHLSGDLGVRFAGVHARAHEPGEIDRREAVALLVLGDLGVGVMDLRADDDGNSLEPCLLRGAQTLGTEEHLVATVLGQPTHNDRLNNPAQRDVLRELSDLLFRELGARVARVFREAVDRDQERQSFGTARADGRGERRSGGINAVFDGVRGQPVDGFVVRLVDEIALLDLRLVPRHAHERIVPLRPSPE